MQEKINIEIEKDLYDNIQMLKEVIPAEDWQWSLTDNEVLKLIVGTFMAFAVDQWANHEHDHDHGHSCCGGECWCSH